MILVPVSVTSILRAQFLAEISWYKNNKWMLASMFFWPYLMILIILGIGSLYGSIEEYKSRLGIHNPLLYMLASSMIAMSSVGIVDTVATFSLWNRWIGTLQYILLTPTKTWKVLLASGVPGSILSIIITLAAVTPGSLYLEGLVGGLKMVVVFGLMLLGMLPLLGLAAIISSVMLVVKEESNIVSSLNPLLILLSGVFYPIEVLPRILQVASIIVPSKYVVDAAKILATYHIPEAKLLFVAVYTLTLLTLAYNTVAMGILGKVEERVRKVGPD